MEKMRQNETVHLVFTPASFVTYQQYKDGGEGQYKDGGEGGRVLTRDIGKVAPREELKPLCTS